MTTRYFDRTRFHLAPSNFTRFDEPTVRFSPNSRATSFNKAASEALIDLTGEKPRYIQWFLSEDGSIMAITPSDAHLGSYRPTFTRSGAAVCGVPANIHEQVKGRKFYAEVFGDALFIDLEKGEI